MEIAMIDRRVVPLKQLDKIYLDRGIYFGDGVYEVLRSYNGKIFAMNEHLERFARSLDQIKIIGTDIEQIRQRVEQAFAEADIKNAKIYFHITRGSQQRQHAWPEDLRPRFFLTVTELDDNSKEKENGIAVSTHPDWRWKRCDIKSLNLLANVLARKDAEEKGCTEAILVDEEGVITEGSGSAFFIITNQKLLTTPLGTNILPSITRKYVLMAADKINLETIEKKITPKQAQNADEAFIAVTTKDIVPVVKFDEKTIGIGKVGNYTKMLIQEFQSFIS